MPRIDQLYKKAAANQSAKRIVNATATASQPYVLCFFRSGRE
jgi:hypothetical protein